MRVIPDPRKALLLAICTAALCAEPAAARRLVEPGDLLVSAGDAVFAVRADGLGVAPFSPRPGSGPHLFSRPSGIAVDPVGGRVFVADDQGRVFLVDPADGAQTELTSPLGATLALGDTLSDLTRLPDGGLLAVGSTLVSTFPLNEYASFLYLLSAPSASGATVASVASEDIPGGLAPPVFGLDFADPSLGDPQILLSSFTIFGSLLSTVNAATGVRSDIAGVPSAPGRLLADAALDCSAGIASLCVRYWIEAVIFETDCVAAGALVFRASFLSTETPIEGSPLRCPIALAVEDAGDTIFLLDAEAELDELRVYRFERDPSTDIFTPFLLTGDGELPDIEGGVISRIAVSSVALPEPAGAALAAIALAALACAARRRFTAG